MESNTRDIDVFISKTLEGYDKTYSAAAHFILLECITEAGLDKDEIAKSIRSYASDALLDKLGSSSFMAKTCLKRFVALNTDDREFLLNELIEILDTCDEEEGLLVIPEQPQLVKENKPKVESKRVLEVNDSNLGTIKVYRDSGWVEGDGISYRHNNTEYNGLPFDFSLDYEIWGLEDKIAHVQENIENDIELYVSEIACIHSQLKRIEDYVLSNIWDWFADSNQGQGLLTRYIRLCVSVFVHLSNENNSSIWMTAEWCFEEEFDETEGYFEFHIDKESGRLRGSDLNYS